MFDDDKRTFNEQKGESSLITVHGVDYVAVRLEYKLPLDIVAYRQKLVSVREAVQKLAYASDGIIFKYIGLDAFLSVIPVVGSLYTVGGSTWLFVQSFKVRSPASDKVTLFLLTFLDMAVGFFGAGTIVGPIIDGVIRVHAWSAQQMMRHIDSQLALIDEAAVRAAQGGNSATVIEHLRDQIFRSGKTEKQQWLRWAAIVGMCAAVLAYCDYRADVRSANIAACEIRGGWFCSWKH